MVGFMESIITIIGVLTLVILGIQAVSEKDSAVVKILKKLNALMVSVGAFFVVLLVVFLNYESTRGILTIKSIGLYIACFSILAGMISSNGLGSWVSNISVIAEAKAKNFSEKLEESAKKAKSQGGQNPDNQDTGGSSIKI